MSQCRLCRTESRLISKALKVCLGCIRKHPEASRNFILKAHFESRREFGLPEVPPRDPGGILCNRCVNQCRIPENGSGYCGLRKNIDGRLKGASAVLGTLSWYHDPLPTNCVGNWVCAGGTGAGYPDHAHCPDAERGYKNLAVFFKACSFNCLYCQNWHYRNQSPGTQTESLDHLVADVDRTTSCICYFGGDPAPQLPFSLRASRQAIREKKGQILRICWETNGSMQKPLLDAMIETALISGGSIKFDLKAWDETLHTALTGVTNRQTLKNFERTGRRFHERSEPPILIASTLMVPGYIDSEEVGHIAAFIASVDPGIPYTLLAFYPMFYMSDMPQTTKADARQCLNAAREAGLTRVRVGNRHLLE